MSFMYLAYGCVCVQKCMFIPPQELNDSTNYDQPPLVRLYNTFNYVLII